MSLVYNRIKLAKHFDSLQSMLISRFLLNLRQVGSPEGDSQTVFNSQFSAPGFRVPTLGSMIGNMGQDLDHNPAEEVEDEDGAENVSDSVQAENMAVSGAIIEGYPSSTISTPSTSGLVLIA